MSTWKNRHRPCNWSQRTPHQIDRRCPGPWRKRQNTLERLSGERMPAQYAECALARGGVTSWHFECRSTMSTSCATGAFRAVAPGKWRPTSRTDIRSLAPRTCTQVDERGYTFRDRAGRRQAASAPHRATQYPGVHPDTDPTAWIRNGRPKKGMNSAMHFMAAHILAGCASDRGWLETLKRRGAPPASCVPGALIARPHAKLAGRFRSNLVHCQ